MEILDVAWFCAGHGNVGIVKVRDEYDGVKYYIGQCSGEDSDRDIDHIAAWGSSFPFEVGELLFGFGRFCPDGRVLMPQSLEEAQSMNLVSEHYLRSNS